MKSLSESSQAWRRLQLSRAKLKTSTKNSALLAGFAMIAMVELSLEDDEQNPIPLPLLIFFGVITTLLVSIHLSALMISSCILPHIDAIALSDERDLESINDSPHDKMHIFIETAWIFSNILGIVLFLFEIGALAWVKFWELGTPNGKPGKKTAIAASAILLLAISFFLFYVVYFYKQLADHNFRRSRLRIRDLEARFETSLVETTKQKRRFTFWPRSSVLKESKQAKKSSVFSARF